jgi:hypothetical protein
VTLVRFDCIVHCLTEKESFLGVDGFAPGCVNIDSSIKTGCITYLGVLD